MGIKKVKLPLGDSECPFRFELRNHSLFTPFPFSLHILFPSFLILLFLGFSILGLNLGSRHWLVNFAKRYPFPFRSFRALFRSFALSLRVLHQRPISVSSTLRYFSFSIEHFFGRLSDLNLCVTQSMQQDLQDNWGIM